SYSASVKGGRVFTLSPADPLYSETDKAHDAFSAFCVLFHSGDEKRALKDACDNWLRVDGVPWNEYYRAGCQANEAPEAPPAKPYDELLAEAGGFDLETSPADVEALVTSLDHLGVLEQRRVLEEVKRKTKLPLGVLMSAGAVANDPQEKPDQKALADELVTLFGQDNVIADDIFVRQWHKGLWRELKDRAIKQKAQRMLGDMGVAGISKSIVDGVTDIFKSEVYRPDHQFDTASEKESVNCLNGELQHGPQGWRLIAPVREHYRTTQIPVAFDPGAIATKFEAFLASIFKGDADAQEKRQAVLEMVGYTLMSHCRFERFIILVGSGANG
ncbi:MAG: hypothetical protein OIF35_03670, partial [Cellvibrionaceae bacterium]|nr:hypothetical protein [Cellvibrionaceae bacterium]